MSVAAVPIEPEGQKLPDYLPARMVNEFVYCPRLFYYEWVEGLFAESADTVEGKFQHRRVDEKEGALPPPKRGPHKQTAAGQKASASDKGSLLATPEERIHARSVTLSSDAHRVIARIDLVEAEGDGATPVDYKHGRPREGPDGELELWPADRAQLAVQGLVLRANGYRCDEGVAFYEKTRQRARVRFDAGVIGEAEAAIKDAWTLAASGRMPEPLEDSPKCSGCSLAGICLPDETNLLLRAEPDGAAQLLLFERAEDGARKSAQCGVRRLVSSRDELRPVYLNTPGLRVGKSGEVLQVKEKDSLVQEIRLGEVCQLNVMGNVQLSTQAIQALCEADIPVCYFSMGGWFYGITKGLNQKNVFLRQTQFRLADAEWFARSLARRLVSGKIRNQRTMLQRNHVEPGAGVLRDLKEAAERAEEAKGLEELLGIEGNAARLYFGEFEGMIKPDEDDGSGFSFDFRGRNRRPPRDPVNALLSLAYSLLAKDLTIAAYAVGFDPFVGYYHQPRFGRPALALDLMEPFRPLVADSAVLSAINTKMVTARDFVRAGEAVALTAEGRKAFYRAYELRMDTMVTHPLFDYRVTYRRLLEIQVRLLARVLDGEIGAYPVFVTR